MPIWLKCQLREGDYGVGARRDCIGQEAIEQITIGCSLFDTILEKARQCAVGHVLMGCIGAAGRRRSIQIGFNLPCQWAFGAGVEDKLGR